VTNVTIDASCLSVNPYSGLSEVVRNLILHLPWIDRDINISLFVNYFRSQIPGRDMDFPGTTNYLLRIPRRLTSYWWRHNRPPIDFLLPKTDVFHSLHIEVPPVKKVKTILTVHDCRYLAMPELYRISDVRLYQRQMETSLSRADRVVTVSEFTKGELIKYFSYPEAQIETIYNGFDSSPAAITFSAEDEKCFGGLNLPQSYLLYTGVLDPRKNLTRLLKAIAICCSNHSDFPDLVIAGISRKQWMRSDPAGAARELGLIRKIHPVGITEKNVLNYITKNARVLCYPSLYEGFGFPPLEAMALNVPVLAANASSIPEVTGDAACLVDPQSGKDIARGLERVVYDSEYRRILIGKGSQRLEKFSWEKTASQYTRLYRDILS